MEVLKQEDFLARFKAQGVPVEHFAVKCVVCDTVQSMHALIVAGAGTTKKDVACYFGFSCVGRFTNAGAHNKGTPPGRGCDWTLGGLFHIHRLEVVDAAGKHHPHFEIATPEEAQALMASFSRELAASA